MAYILLRAGSEFGKQGSQHQEFLIESPSDLSSLPTNTLAPGSTAHTPGYAKMYELGFDGSWVEVGVSAQIGDKDE